MITKRSIVLACLCLTLTAGCTKWTPDLTRSKVQSLLEKTVIRNPDLNHGILLLHSDRLDIHWKFAYGTVGREHNPITADHTYHIASIGKTMTSALIAKLYEEGRISYEDPISTYLSKDILEDLHVYEGKSYSDQILVKHLLNHTSGIADYFEEKPKSGKSILELAVADPGRFWTPLETIQWTKDNLEAHFPPGEGFHYSDTGYQLLGLIIENITGRPMHESLHEYLFDPLGMVHSYQLFYSEPAVRSPYPIADILLDRVEVSTYRSLSVDWAGGGVVSTTEDLLLFHRALVNNTLLKEETFSKWMQWEKFGKGIDYGYGLVYLKFEDMLFLLSEKLDVWGNWGSISTYMFYNPYNDIYLIGAFNQSTFIRKQVRFMIKVLTMMSRLSET